MPDKPSWYAGLDDAIKNIQQLPDPFVGSATLEHALHVGRRRAQQILAPLVSQTIGRNGLARREDVVAHLRGIGNRDQPTVQREEKRRQRLAHYLGEFMRPGTVVVDPHLAEANCDRLPPGVKLEPGRITIEFDSPAGATEKLFAVAMAMQNDYDWFVRVVQCKRL